MRKLASAAILLATVATPAWASQRACMQGWGWRPQGRDALLDYALGALRQSNVINIGYETGIDVDGLIGSVLLTTDQCPATLPRAPSIPQPERG